MEFENFCAARLYLYADFLALEFLAAEKDEHLIGGFQSHLALAYWLIPKPMFMMIGPIRNVMQSFWIASSVLTTKQLLVPERLSKELLGFPMTVSINLLDTILLG